MSPKHKASDLFVVGGMVICCTCSLMVNRGCDNVLDEYNKGPTELVAEVNMLHMLSYGQQGGGGGVW